MYKSYDEWLLEWECHVVPILKQDTQDEDFLRSVHLLRTYAASYSFLPDIMRFFQRRWATHAVLVESVVYWHTYIGTGAYKGAPTVYSLLKHLREKLSPEDIQPGGDLAAILKVIQQKTNLDFADLPTRPPAQDSRPSSVMDPKPRDYVF